MAGKKIIVNADVCTGCRSCEQVCSLMYTKKEINPKKSKIRIKSDSLNAYDEPVVCCQCEEKHCMEACAFEAIVIDEKTGAAKVIVENCTGCGSCVDACPYNAMFMDEENGVALKCDLCGGDPQCIKVCTMKAISF